jgi:AraC-like DNA-binding protein
MPGLRQAEHEHASAQITFLLVGGLRERVGRQEADVLCPAAGVKPVGVRHSADFGRWGAMMLALELAEGKHAEAVAGAAPCQWFPSGETASLLIRMAVGSAGERLRVDMLWDLLGATAGSQADAAPPPAWIRQVHQRISDAPEDADIGAIAADIGIHRVHLSRAFRRFYGLPPSLYRMRCMASRAMSLVVGAGVPLADAAYTCGFADQSHMTRIIGGQIGLPPARARNLLRNVTSVQEGVAARR